MNAERTVTIVIGREPVLSKPPLEARRAGLSGAVAAVLSTYRSDNPDMGLDHTLWLACVGAVMEVVEADESRVFAEPPLKLLDRLLWRQNTKELGSLDEYAGHILNTSDPAEWSSIHWHRDSHLVGVAVAEAWYLSGGPEPYHDSYTTRIYLDPLLVDSLVAQLRQKVEVCGGRIERIDDLRNK